MSEADDFVDAIVVGAGVVGLAVARALALSGRAVVVLEREGAIGTGTSSRNSEVIHAGLYYPPGSLKARFCVEGRRALYAYCAARGVPHRRCGKLLVAASEDEIAAVATIAERGRVNGAEDLVMISGAEARRMEPELTAVAALWSPQTGIIDSHAYMLALQGDAENAGAVVAFNTPFVAAEPAAQGFLVRTGGVEPMRLACRELVNAAGLSASDVADCIAGLSSNAVPRTHFCKGSYFILAGRAPFSRLIYPAPSAHGLGVHLTLDLGGQARFGPDTEWVDAVRYEVDGGRRAAFVAAIRRYWPGLDEEALSPGYSGIRPKIVGEGEPAADFRIDGPQTHGMAGLVNLLGIESPGLTASLAIAEEVLARLEGGRPPA
ncbi:MULTISPECIES: NAD(P)/FAD-dependent oxidoreductase [Chelatococcus]|uniref:FAD-dependent oxidoreductase n=1 Tax=Chelatococcus daeguensis TaxID=444444 RepID=A0AAC9JLV6_9HYPH|nr:MULTISPECIES: NAD(P)/FAD-dependent oxidoreductase [Chelatococcus]APF35973.1 FAD-dependent oxidoreductase [Chelatococcus daeguensis]